MKARAITGLGVVSTLGEGRAAFFEGLRTGAIAKAEGGRAEVPAFDPTRTLGDKGLRSLDRLTKLLLVAARQGLADAGLKKDGAWSGVAGEDVGLVCSNAYGSLEAITELDRVALLEDARYINPSRFPLTVANSAAGYASIWEDLRAVNVSVSDGNCGGLDAFAAADTLLAHRRAKALLVGGAEAMSDALYLAFRKVAAIGSGLLGEGSALVALETTDAAAARGATVLAEVTGYGTSFCPPPRETSLLFPSSEAVRDAVLAALTDAGLGPTDVDVVVTGMAGEPAFDEAELVGLGQALELRGGDGPWVVAPKRALGETLGAGGAMGVLAALAVLREHGRPFTVRGTIRTAPRTALVTALGYYGNASALVIRLPSR